MMKHEMKVKTIILQLLLSDRSSNAMILVENFRGRIKSMPFLLLVYNTVFFSLRGD